MTEYHVDADHLYAVVGPPRTGSMVTYNILRECARQSGLKVIPEDVPPLDEDMLQAIHRKLCGRDEILAIKLHSEMEHLDQFAGVILNIRDIRDAACSYMHFAGESFDNLVSSLKYWIDLSNYTAAHADLVIRFEDLQLKLPQVVKKIANLLGVAGLVDTYGIAEKFALEQVAKHCSEISTPIVVYKGDGKPRKYDPETGFQTGHVRGTTNWRRDLNPWQQARITEVCADWLNANGYRL